MATITSNGTGGGSWSSTATWSGGALPSDGDAVVIAAGDAVLADVDLSAWTGLTTLTITGIAAGTPGMLYFKDGTNGHIKFRDSASNGILGTNTTVLGRLLANSNGTWGGTTPLTFANKAVIDLVGAARITATYLDIALYCTNPATTYVETYKTSYTCTTQSTGVNASTDEITFTSAPPSAGTAVMVRSSGTLPGGLTTTDIYYTRSISSNTCKLALQNSDATIVDITSTGSGTLTMYDGHTDTATATMNVIQDVTAVTGWTTTDGHDRVLLSDNGPESVDAQPLQLTTINAGSIVLSANVDSVQYPCSRIYMMSRNVSIRSSATSNISIVNFGLATTRSGVFQCELINTSSSGSNYYGYGIGSGTSHTVSGTINACNQGLASCISPTISGIIANCSYGVYSPTSCDVSGIVAGCGTAISTATSATVSGTIIGCTTGFNGNASTISGLVRGCSTGISTSIGNTISGTVSACTSGMASGTGNFISGTVKGCATGITTNHGALISGSVTGCTTGISSSVGLTISGAVSKCVTGISYCDFIGSSLAFSNNTTDIAYSGTSSGQLVRSRSFRHGDVDNDTRAWSAGGKMEHETSTVPSGKSYSHKFTFENSSYWTIMEWELSRASLLAISLTVHVKHDSSSLTGDECVRWEIIDPASDPLFGGSALATQTALGNTTDWQAFTLAYTRADDRPVLIRASAKRASGTSYIYMDTTTGSGGLLTHPGMTGGCNG